MIVGYLNVIVILSEPNERGNKAMKFHNIKDTPHKKHAFCAWVKGKYPAAIEANFYYKKIPGNRKGFFQEKIYLQ